MRPKLEIVSVALVAASCFTSFPDVEEKDSGAASGGQPNGGVGGLGGNWGGGGVAGGSADASTDAEDASAESSEDAAPDVVQIPGLLGHWPFDDGSGSVAVDVVAGNDAHLPPADVTWTTAGVLGGALQLAQPLTGIVVNEWDGTAFPETGTLSVWIKTVVVPNDTSSRSVFDNHNAGRSHVFVRRSNGSPLIALQCAFQVANQPYAFVKNTPVASDEWQLVAVGWSPTDGFCYVNGTKLADVVSPGFSPSQQIFTLGAHMIGTMDDVRLYDHVLSDSELAELQAARP